MNLWELYVSDRVVKKIKRHPIKHDLRWMYKEKENIWDLLFIFISVIYNIFYHLVESCLVSSHDWSNHIKTSCVIDSLCVDGFILCYPIT